MSGRLKSISGSGAPASSKTWPLGSTIDLEPDVVEMLIEEFSSHWLDVRSRALAAIDLAPERADCFFACDERAALRVARAYYSPKRVADLSAASPQQILRRSRTWIGTFQAESRFWGSGRRDLRKGLRKLVRAEYVALIWRPGGVGPVSGDIALAFPLPDSSVAYGDIYEITAGGASDGASLRLCKSTSEPFSAFERKQAEVGIWRDFLESAEYDGDECPESVWRIKFLDSGDTKAIDAIISPRKQFRRRGRRA